MDFGFSTLAQKIKLLNSKHLIIFVRTIWGCKGSAKKTNLIPLVTPGRKVFPIWKNIWQAMAVHVFGINLPAAWHIWQGSRPANGVDALWPSHNNFSPPHQPNHPHPTQSGWTLETFYISSTYLTLPFSWWHFQIHSFASTEHFFGGGEMDCL